MATARHKVLGDYFVIEYNAATRKTFWSDYHHEHDPNKRDENMQPVDRNGSFLPVVYSKEKIAVHVCDLHFTDQLTVTTNPFAVPEGGADIRGATPTALTPVTASLDTLQTTSQTGGPVPQGGLGFSPETALGSLALSGITPSSLVFDETKPATTYTTASLTTSGKQAALLLYAFRADADSLYDSVEATAHHVPLAEAAATTSPGNIDFINSEVVRIRKKIMDDMAAQDANSDAAGFDENVNEVQGLSANLTTLSSALTTAGFGGRAVALQTNYATLRGVLDLVKQGEEQKNCQVPPGTLATLDPKRIRGLSVGQIQGLTPHEVATFSDQQFGELSEQQISWLTADQIKALTAKELTTLKPSQVKGLSAPQILAMTKDQIEALSANPNASFSGAPAMALGAPHKDAPPADDRPNCGRFEQARFQAFRDSFEKELNELGEPDAKAFLDDASRSRDRMFDALGELRSDLVSIDGDIGDIFSQVNVWYKSSSVEQTDVVDPANGNAVMRISIVVNRGYTPFTLTSNPAAAAAAAPAAPASAAGSASTSTPAHAVKTVLVEVHRLANFNLMGGVVLIHVPTTNYSVSPGTSPVMLTETTTTSTATPPVVTATYTFTGVCGGVTGTISSNSYTPPPNNSPTGPSSYACLVAPQQSDWQLAGMVGLTWYPFGRDYFPRHNGYSNYGRNYIPSLLLATSVTSLGTALGGVNFEPVSGINFFAGIASAKTNVLPSGITSTTILPSTYTLPSTTKLGYGFAAGIGLDLGVFGQLFSKPAGALQ